MLLKNFYEIGTEDEARQLAIDWQDWQAEESLSWREVAEWQSLFIDLGQRFGLLDEFEENGII